MPAEKETITILVDTTQSSNFYMQTFKTETLISKGGFTEWREVVCDKEVDKNFIIDLQSKLMKKGYLNQIDYQKNSVGAKLKKALINYQRENNLPVGNMDMETLASLGIVM